MTKKSNDPYNVKNMKIGVAYARFSSDNQREESIEAQVRAIKYYAQKFNIDIIHVYSDRAKTGKTDDRPQFRQMVEDSKNHEFDVVIVHKLDRFSRNPADANYYEQVLNNNGVQLISVIENLDNSPEGQLMKQIIIGMNSFYSANLAREVRKGLKETALQGKFTGGVPLFGYDIVDGDYEINEINAEAVRMIFELYVQGYGKTRIAKILNDEGYKSSRNNYFSPRTIYDILKNEKYIGSYVYNMEDETILLDDAIPPIISYELWLAAQEESKKINKAKYREQKRHYHLTGKMECGECGGRYAGGTIKKNKYGSVYYYYTCNNNRNKVCSNKNVNKEFIENMIIDEIGEKILSDDVIEKIADEAVRYAKREIEKPKVSLSELQKNEKSLEKKKEKLTELFMDELIEKDMFNKKYEKLKEDLRIIKSEIRKATQIENSPELKKDDFIDYIKSYRLDTSDEEVVKSLIDTFVEKVAIYNDRIDVTFKIDFNVIGGNSISRVGEIVRSGGVIRSLTPILFKHSYSRKILKSMKKQNDNIINYNKRQKNK